MDHIFTPNNQAFLRYENRKDDYQDSRRAFCASSHHCGNLGQHSPQTSGPPAMSPPFAPIWSMKFRAGVVILVSASSAGFNGQSALQQIGIQGLPNRGVVDSLPFFSISGFSNNNINLLSPVNDGHAQFADNLPGRTAATRSSSAPKPSAGSSTATFLTIPATRSLAVTASPASSPAMPTRISCWACPLP